MAKKKQLEPSENFEKFSDGDLADKLGFITAATAQPLTDIEVIKGILKNRAIGKIKLAADDTPETIGAKLEKAGNAGLFKGKLFEVNVFPQGNSKTDMDAVRAKLQELMPAPGQFTRFMNKVVTTTLKWVAKTNVLQAAIVQPPPQPGEKQEAA